MATGKKRGPKGPRFDDWPALAAMVPLVTRGVKLATAAREVIRLGLVKDKQSDDSTIHRLRRKFRQHRQALVSGRRSDSLPLNRAATPDEIRRFVEHEARHRTLAIPRYLRDRNAQVRAAAAAFSNPTLAALNDRIDVTRRLYTDPTVAELIHRSEQLSAEAGATSPFPWKRKL
jgi:hypothetical protein